MKKTLLSVLAGLTVMGSAFADGPSVEDRKKLCQLLIDKGTHVWVEKTKACIPVNPCKSDDVQIKEAYCINDLTFDGVGYHLRLHLYDKSMIDIAVAKIAERLGTGATSQNLPGNFFAMKTTDGGYYVGEYDTKKVKQQPQACTNESQTIALIFGNRFKSGTGIVDDRMIEYRTQIPVTEQECTDMKDIGHLLYGYASRQTDIKYDKDQKECIFTCFY